MNLNCEAKWRSGGEVDRQVLREANVRTNEDYRRYLQNQADKIVLLNQNNACASVSTLCSINDHNTSTFSCCTPYLYTDPMSRAEPLGYENSNLKREYLEEYRAASALTRIRVDKEEMHELKGMFATDNRLT